MTKSKIKSYLSVLLLMMLVITCVFAFASCGKKKNKVNQIYVDNAHAPRLTYVQGQELDLQKGILTAEVGKKSEATLISMTDSSISVSGYNKDTLGTQHLIVSYGGKTTTITVNVIPRIVVEGYESAYFTGDTLNKVKGKLKVAKDDATTFMVSFDDPRVSFSTLDSATPGEKSVTVTYKDGSASYSTSYNVLVYDAASSTIEIVYPKKTSYGNHEAELDFTGGYITIKGGSNGKLEKHVDLTEAEVTGYDPSAVNLNNTTVDQTITISYLGKTFTYTIKLKYSNVSLVQDYLAIINEIDLESENLTITNEQKIASWNAVSEYLALKDAEKAIFSEDDVNTILRVASICVTELYLEEFKNYEQTLNVTKEGVVFVCDSYENTLRDRTKLKDSSELLNRYASVLRTLLADHSDLVVRDNKKVSDEVFVIPENVQKNIVDALSHMISLYEDLAIIPTDWTIDKLKQMDADSDMTKWAEPRLYRARVDIATASYFQSGQSYIYNLLSKWREKDDFFEIIYSYFRYCYYDTEEEAVQGILALLDTVPWPKTINTWYSNWYTVMNYSSTIEAAFKEDPSKVFLTDLTPYNYYFASMIEMASEINANKESDPLTAELYYRIAGDTRIRQARNKGYGLLKLRGFLVDETTGFSEAWSTYLELVKLYAKGSLVNEEGAIITQGYEEQYEAVMNKLFELSPLELHEFLGSINFYYGKTNSEVLTLTPQVQEVDGKTQSIYLSTLATLMNAYYIATFDEAEFEMFEKLLIAMESYARINKIESAKATFITNMAQVITAYDALKAQNKTALFDSKMGAGYDKYVKLYNAILAETNIAVSEEALNQINKLLAAAVKLETIRDYLIAESSKPEEERSIRNEAYMVLFALYENTRYAYLTLTNMAKSDEELRLALYQNTYEYDGAQLTIEEIFGKVGNYFWNYAITIPDISVTEGEAKYTYPFYDIYIGTGITEFLLNAADMLYAQFYESNVSAFSETAFKNVFASFVKLDKAPMIYLEFFKITDLYFAFMEEYIEEFVTDETTLSLAAKLIEVVNAYANYVIVNSETNANTIKTLINEATALKNSITSGEDYEKYLKAIYEYYSAIQIA